VAQDENLRRITVSNDDGDVYVESAGDGSEIVLKTEKVRVDGDVYCGTSTVGLAASVDVLNAKDDSLDERIDALNETQTGLRDDLVSVNATTSSRFASFDASMNSLEANNDALDVQIDALNASHIDLSARLDALKVPPKCVRPGGDKLQYDGSEWLCICNGAFGGETCETTWTPEARIVNATEAYADVHTVSENACHVSADGDEILVGNGGLMRTPMILKRSSTSGTWEAVWNLSLNYLWIPETHRDITNVGASVSLAGDLAVLGAPYQQLIVCRNSGCTGYSPYEGPGFVLVFQRGTDSTTTWSMVANLTASDLNIMSDVYSYGGYAFGYDVAATSSHILVSTQRVWNDMYEETLANASVYVFERQGSNNVWSETTKLTSGSGNSDDSFGSSISISGDYAVIGASGDVEKGARAGAAYVFKRSTSDGTWALQRKVTAYDASSEDNFGYSVSISGNYILIGSPHDDEAGADSGSAYLYERSPATDSWSFHTKITPTNGASGDRFGSSVVVKGTRLLIGAPYKASAFGGSGLAYLFERHQETGSWEETGKLTDFEGLYGEFTKHVALSDDYAIGASNMQNSYAGSLFVVANLTSVPR